MKSKRTRIKADAECASFDINLNATITSTNLTAEEVNDIKRKFKQQITTTIAKLPFAHIYPFEVTVK
jgi:hypothetical protein